MLIKLLSGLAASYATIIFIILFSHPYRHFQHTYKWISQLNY